MLGIAAAHQQSRKSAAVGRKPLGEGLFERVEVVRIPVVEEVPDDGNALLLGGFHVRQGAGKVQPAPAVYAVPADAVADGVDAGGAQVAIVLAEVEVVAGQRELVNALAVAVDGRGALE